MNTAPVVLGAVEGLGVRRDRDDAKSRVTVAVVGDCLGVHLVAVALTDGFGCEVAADD